MKHIRNNSYIPYFILFFFFHVFLSCKQSVKENIVKVTNLEEKPISEKCDSNLKQKDTKIQKDSIVSIGQLYTNVFVFKNTKNKTYFVRNKLNKTLLKNLNYFGRIDGGFQALTNENEIVFYNLKLKKLNQAPEPEFLGVCGNVSSWKVKIEEKGDNYIVKKLEGHSGSYGGKWQSIDSIPKLDSKDIYFLNKTKSIEYDGNFYYPETIIIAYGNNFVIRKNKKTFVFDTVDIPSLKVKCNGLFGYFERTEIKYTKLDSFQYNLAQFELPDGRKGYINLLGNEFLN